MKRLLSVPLVLALAAGAVTGVVATAPAALAATTAGRYVPVAPVRLVDTREGNGPLGSDSTLPLDLSARVPASATAVVLNLTADAPSDAGYLTVYPADELRPVASSINKRAGETRSNSVTVALPANGSRSLLVYNQIGTTQVVVDLFGYYDPTAGATGSDYYPYTAPARLFDSRSAERFGPDSAVVIPVPTPPIDTGVSDVRAVALNITAVDPSAPGFLTAWDGSDPEPVVSTVNYGTDAATPNFAIVPTRLDTDGVPVVTIANAAAAVDIVVDIVGLYAEPGAPGATAYVPVTPTRLGDTRDGRGPVQGGTSFTTVVPAASGDVPVAANLNVTAADGTVGTYLTVYRDDTFERPLVSTLNPAAGQVVPNAAQTLLGGVDRGFRIYNLAGSVDVVCDLQGYFVSDGTTPAALPAPGPAKGATRTS